MKIDVVAMSSRMDGGSRDGERQSL